MEKHSFWCLDLILTRKYYNLSVIYIIKWLIFVLICGIVLKEIQKCKKMFFHFIFISFIHSYFGSWMPCRSIPTLKNEFKQLFELVFPKFSKKKTHFQLIMLQINLRVCYPVGRGCYHAGCNNSRRSVSHFRMCISGGFVSHFASSS